MLWNDKQIRFAAEWGMIDPYAPTQVRRVDGAPVISFGVSSFGYDMRLGDTFQIFRPVHDFPAKPGDRLGPVILDPKAFDARVAQTVQGATCIIPPHGFALAYSLERFAMPSNVLGVCLGKSTYARLGVVVGITPLEPGWSGHVTIEMSNTTDLPVKVYANEGIAQVLFLEGDEPEVSYASRGGKYQDQPATIIWARV